MSTLLRQRTNYVWNPRGTVESNTAIERRRNLAPNPRLVNPGSAGVLGTTVPVAYAAGAVGTSTARTFASTVTAVGFPEDLLTSRTVTAQALGATAADKVGEYVDLPAAPGDVRTVSAYLRRVSGAYGKNARIVAEWRNATAALAPQVFGATSLDQSYDGKNYATRVSATTAAAPAGTTTLRVYLWAEGRGGADTAAAVTWEWSALLVEAGTTVRPYFDGASTTSAEGEFYYWEGAPSQTPSVYASVYIDVVDLAGKPRRARAPLNWAPGGGLAEEALAVGWYRWTVDGETVVRIHPPTGGTTPGPYLTLDNDGSKGAAGATFTGTLLVEARREAPGSAATLAPVVNSVALPTQAVGADWAVYRFPVTLKAGDTLSGQLNLVRLGKTGAGPLLVRGAAVIGEANYAGPYFDGNSPTVGATASVWTDEREAPNSSSYQGIPSVSVTAAAEPGDGRTTPPSVTVTVTDADADNPLREVNVLRVDSSGRRTPVRSRTGGPAELPVAAVGTAVVLHDYEVPYGDPVTYVVESATSSDPIPHIASARVTVDSDRAWLIHPGVPARSRPLAIVRLGNRRKRVVEGVFDVSGRGDPIVRTDGKRKSAESELVVRTYTDAERQALDTLLDDAAALLLNIPPRKGWGVTYEWVAIGDSDEQRTAPNLGAWPRRLWPLPYRVVRRPIGGTRAARTWHDVAAEAASWREVPRQHADWRDVADPANPAGA